MEAQEQAYRCGYCQYELGVSIDGLTQQIAMHLCLQTEKNIVVNNDKRIFIENDVEENNNDTDQGAHTDETNKWSEEVVRTLIACYKEHKHKFMSPKYNNSNVWTMISEELKKHKFYFNASKCSEKFRNLKKTYMKIKQHNNATGNEMKSWVFYEDLHEIFFKNPEVIPVATCSSSGAQKRRIDVEEAGSLSESERTPKSKKLDRISIIEKIEENKERRHREKMEQKSKMFKEFMELMFKKQ